MNSTRVSGALSADALPADDRTSLWIAVSLGLVCVAVHMATNGGYGYFRDEMYYLACGDHLDWGYVDHAPLIALTARLIRLTLGDSLPALRFLPALAGGLSVFFTGLIARELGGGRFAVLLASLGVLVTPLYLAIDTIFTMNAFEPLFWMASVLILLRAIHRNRPRLLLWLGVTAGIGLENKHSMAFFIVALLGGLALSPERRLLLTRQMALAAAIALLLFLPNLLWQAAHGWPTLVDLAISRNKNLSIPLLVFLSRQILMLSPANMLIWLPGLWFLLRGSEAHRARALGWAFLLFLGLMLALRGKGYYLAPAYPMLFAAGGVFWQSRIRRRWLRIALPSTVFWAALPAAPLALPILPPQSLIRYQKAIHIAPMRDYVTESGPLQEEFGDMFGWEEMVGQVAQIYRSLPPAERSRAAIFALNYGEAAAIDLFGPRYGLPKAISTNQTYFLWGPHQYDGQAVILVGFNDDLMAHPQVRRGLESVFTSIETGPRVEQPYSMNWEHYSILIGRGLHPPLPELWPHLRLWN